MCVLVVSGGVTSMDDFLKEFIPTVYKKKHAHLHETDYCKNDNKIFSLFTSSLYFAALVTTFGASYVTRTRGRRASILVGSTSFFIGVIVNAFAKNVETLIIGRCFLVGGIGFGNRVTKNIPLLRRGEDLQPFYERQIRSDETDISNLKKWHKLFPYIFQKWLLQKSEEQLTSFFS